jgi:hypothetical protein
VEGLDTSWVASTPALPNAGYLELASSGGTDPTGRPFVGGDDWSAMAGAGPDVAYNWVATGDDAIDPGQPAGALTRGMLDDWRNLFNPHSPSFWLALSLLVAIGFIHLRVNTKFGPAHGNVGIG